MKEYESIKTTIKGLSDPFYRVKGYKPDAFLGKKPFLQSANNFRSRLGIGGTFFRSKTFGRSANNITVECKNDSVNNKVTLTVRDRSAIDEFGIAFSGSGTGSVNNIVVLDKSVKTITGVFDGTGFILGNNVR